MDAGLMGRDTQLRRRNCLYPWNSPQSIRILEFSCVNRHLGPVTYRLPRETGFASMVLPGATGRGLFLLVHQDHADPALVWQAVLFSVTDQVVLCRSLDFPRPIGALFMCILVPMQECWVTQEKLLKTTL